MKKQFKIGVDSQIITPPLGTLLYGYVAKRPATSVHDDLRVSAIAIEQGDLRGIMISADIASVTKKLVDTIRQPISKATGIPEENISMVATHTHSAPAINGRGAWGSTNEEYLADILIPKTIEAAINAASNMQEVLLGIGTTESTVGVNRRELAEDGSIILGQNPFGVFDKTMTVLAFKGLDGKSVANLIHYGCHGTASGRALAISRDWPGQMVDRMEKETGATTIFFNSAIGDAGPRLSNYRTVGDLDINVEEELPDEDLSYLEEVSSLAAIDAMRAYRSIKEYREVSFDMIKGTVHLPYKTPPTLEEAKEQYNNLHLNVNWHAGVQSLKVQALEEIIRMHENNEQFETETEFAQIIYVFNSAIFVPFPFEMFSEIALRLRQHSPFEHTLCMSNANNYYAYLPTQDQLSRGGYEVDSFFNMGGSAHKLVDNTDDIIIAENLRIIREHLNNE